MKNKSHKTGGAAAVACSDLLDSIILGKPSNNSARPALRQIDNMSDELAEMYDYPGIMAIIRDAAKKKGMRFNEADFPDGEVESPNDYIAIFRGSACEFLDRLFESNKGSIAREQAGDGIARNRHRLHGHCHFISDVGRDLDVHDVSMLSNEKS
jgi:hypothetical protein